MTEATGAMTAPKSATAYKPNYDQIEFQDGNMKKTPALCFDGKQYPISRRVFHALQPPADPRLSFPIV